MLKRKMHPCMNFTVKVAGLCHRENHDIALGAGVLCG